MTYPLPWCERLGAPYWVVNYHLCVTDEGWRKRQSGQPMSTIIPWIDALLEVP